MKTIMFKLHDHLTPQARDAAIDAAAIFLVARPAATDDVFVGAADERLFDRALAGLRAIVPVACVQAA